MDKTGEKWRYGKQQVASLALGCLLMLIPPFKCQSTQQQLHRSTGLSEHDHLQLMMQSSANNRLVNDYQIHNKLINEQQQQQQQSWTPLRALKTDPKSLAGAKSASPSTSTSSSVGHEPMRTAESAPNPTGFLMNHQQQQQLATSSSESGRKSACKDKTTAATHPQPQVESPSPTTLERLINRRHVAQENQQAPSKAEGREQDDQEDDNDDGEDEENEDDPATRVNGTTSGDGGGGQRMGSSGEPMHGNESVSLESSLMAPPGLGQMNYYDDQNQQPDDYQQEPAMHSQGPGRDNSAADEEPDDQPEGPAGGGGGGERETPPDEAAERREQEAAEASEAEAANKSALDEQRQAQREIIMAQAQSEAKAIKEQQEALLKQQQLQQQMLLRRHHNDLEMTRPRGDGRRQQHQQVLEKAANNNINKKRSYAGNKNREYGLNWMDENNNDNDITGQYNQQSQRRQHQKTYTSITPDTTSTANWEAAAAASDARRHSQPGQLDIQFSDDLSESRAGKHQMSAAVNQQEDELGVDYSIRRATISSLSPPLPPIPLLQRLEPSATSGTVEFAPANLMGGSDVLPAAQHHHYGAHYGSIGGHHGTKGHHYYQFAQSHKKGQFDSGFKRGGKKFQISGHSSQHGSHAEGHVKWHSKKGKGMHYWDLKHKGGKKYGHGHGHEYGHQYHH